VTTTVSVKIVVWENFSYFDQVKTSKMFDK